MPRCQALGRLVSLKKKTRLANADTGGGAVVQERRSLGRQLPLQGRVHRDCFQTKDGSPGGERPRKHENKIKLKEIFYNKSDLLSATGYTSEIIILRLILK